MLLSQWGRGEGKNPKPRKQKNIHLMNQQVEQSHTPPPGSAPNQPTKKRPGCDCQRRPASSGGRAGGGGGPGPLREATPTWQPGAGFGGVAIHQAPPTNTMGLGGATIQRGRGFSHADAVESVGEGGVRVEGCGAKGWSQNSLPPRGGARGGRAAVQVSWRGGACVLIPGTTVERETGSGWSQD